jgi:poly-gamma-glutamate biosynthesis protein PgsC/CapC
VALMVYGSLATEVATLALAIGLVLALTCYLLTNLSPGGMITPGWIALTVVEDTRKMIVIIAVTALTYGGTHLLQRVVILYGKRLFAAVTMISVLLSTALFLVIHNDYPLLFVHETLGFIIPGLVAYQLVRQPTWPTLLCTSIVSLASSGVLAAGILLGLVSTT